MVTMHDSSGRHIHYLRISVTDRCNLRCRYCMPETGVSFIPHEDVLSYEEIVRLAGIAASLGVDRIRLTGGEPLVRKGLPSLVSALKSVKGIRFVGLTTNGILLGEQAHALKDAGLDAVNISIDTLDADRYTAITRRPELARALAGLDAALAAGIGSVKVNCVLSPDSLPDDWLAVAGLAKRYPADVRFIEWMPLAGEQRPEGRADEARAMIQDTYGQLEPAASESDGGPARLSSLPGFLGKIGFIEAMSRAFCDRCNRLRLTSAGDLKLCLFYDVGVALKPLLRSGADDAIIRAAIEQAIAVKPRAHQGVQLRREAAASEPVIASVRGMYQTGG